MDHEDFLSTLPDIPLLEGGNVFEESGQQLDIARGNIYDGEAVDMLDYNQTGEFMGMGIDTISYNSHRWLFSVAFLSQSWRYHPNGNYQRSSPDEWPHRSSVRPQWDGFWFGEVSYTSASKPSL